MRPVRDEQLTTGHHDPLQKDHHQQPVQDVERKAAGFQPVVEQQVIGDGAVQDHQDDEKEHGLGLEERAAFPPGTCGMGRSIIPMIGPKTTLVQLDSEA